MIKKKHLIFSFLLYFFYTNAQIPPTIQWETNMGGSNRDQAESVLHTNDGGYIVAGWTDSNNGDVSQNSGGRNAWVVKLDMNGNLQWEKSYGGNGAETIYDIKQTTDGGYVMAGINSSQSNGNYDFWVVKLDTFGNLLWDVVYGGSNADTAYSIEQTIDGGYIVVGATSSDNGDVGQNYGNIDAWVVKLNGNGSLIWEQNYGGTGTDGALDVQQTMDGGYIVGGASSSNDGDLAKNQGLYDTWVFKLTSTGNLTWSYTFGGTSYDRLGNGVFVDMLAGDFIQQTNDGGYIVVGGTASNDGDIGQNQGGADVWIYKLDINGNLIWEETYGGTSDDSGVMLLESLDGNFIVAAQTMSNNGDVGQNQGMTDYWVFKIDPTGNLLWEQTYGGSDKDFLSSIQQVSGCEFILAGHSESNDGDVNQNNGNADFWVVKLQMQWPPPTVNSPQNFCWSDNAVLADIPVTGDPQPGFAPVFTWYDDSLKTNILPETTILADGENYFVSQTIDGCESPLAEVVANINDPIPTAVSPQEFCEGDDASIADLSVAGQNLAWYADAAGNTPIPTNTSLQDGETYYVSQTIDGCESSLVAVTAIVNPSPTLFDPPPLTACDSDGKTEFHLPSLDNDITGGDPDLSVSYHPSFPDAENGTNALPDDYTNTVPFSQVVFARVVDNITNCHAIVEVNLFVSPTPEIANVEDLTGCDNGNGEAVFDLTENNPNILGSQNAQNLKITYHHNQTEAENGQNPIPGPENHQSGPGDVFVRLENTQTGCFDTGVFKISVLPRPDIANISIREEFCSDLPGGDFATIDLTVYDQQINPNAPANTEVVYYENLNAYNARQPIQNPGSHTTTANPQTIIAETTNTETGCPSLVFGEIEISINDRPVVDISQYDGRAICWDSNPATPVHGGNNQAIVLNTGLDESEHTFSWTLNGEILPTTGSSLEAVEPGKYEVVVSDMDGTTTCTSTSKATIVEANPPEFRLSRTSGFVASEHGILVSEINGIGNFEFRLDDGNWVSLEGGRLLFENVAPGTHSVYGRSLEGCGTTIKTITLIGYPKFFTPNNDGSNDRWNIIGLHEGEVFIFDRYGKLLASLDPQRQGWDGTYNGKAMPSDDYWFKVEFVEKLPDGSERSGEFKANFSLIR